MSPRLGMEDGAARTGQKTQDRTRGTHIRLLEERLFPAVACSGAMAARGWLARLLELGHKAVPGVLVHLLVPCAGAPRGLGVSGCWMRRWPLWVVAGRTGEDWGARGIVDRLPRGVNLG